MGGARRRGLHTGLRWKEKPAYMQMCDQPMATPPQAGLFHVRFRRRSRMRASSFRSGAWLECGVLSCGGEPWGSHWGGGAWRAESAPVWIGDPHNTWIINGIVGASPPPSLLLSFSPLLLLSPLLSSPSSFSCPLLSFSFLLSSPLLSQPVSLSSGQ